METPFNQLCNQLSPIFNYFKLLQSFGNKEHDLNTKRNMDALIEAEKEKIMNYTLPEILKILDENE